VSLKEAIQDGKRGLKLYEECSDTVAKYPRFVHDYIRLLEASKVVIEELIPREGWQTCLKEYLAGDVDTRKVIWYFDSTGNSGKSYFSTRYRAKTSYLVTGGKNQDIYYAYNYEEVVFFDLPRAKQEYVPYDVMESFKNGYFLSTKYECKPVRFAVPHVVVFANFYPDTSKLSLDRWEIKEI
jgi:hypothetical protein